MGKRGRQRNFSIFPRRSSASDPGSTKKQEEIRIKILEKFGNARRRRARARARRRRTSRLASVDHTKLLGGRGLRLVQPHAQTSKGDPESAQHGGGVSRAEQPTPEAEEGRKDSKRQRWATIFMKEVARPRDFFAPFALDFPQILKGNFVEVEVFNLIC